MRIDICVATFRRPALLERLLTDLLAQQLPDGVSTHIIVVDNDAQESARPVIAAFQATSASVEYLTQPEQNIALTRNRALDHSQGELIAFIDDDESAPVGWLATLLATMERHAADVVLGPVTGILPPNAPDWIAKGRFFEPPALPSGTRVDSRSGGTGNVLMKASAIRSKVRFDPRYGLSGSSDTDFFHQMFCSGTRMVWCQEAMLTEHVPPCRLTLRYLLSRGFAAGQGYADIIERPDSVLRVLLWVARRSTLAAAAAALTLSCLPFSKAAAFRYATKVASNVGQVSTILEHRHQRYRR